MKYEAPTWFDIVLTILLAPPLAAVVIVVLGMMIEGVTRQNEQHDRCLAKAENRQEIQAKAENRQEIQQCR